jgi:hypothetical protein
MRSKEKKKNGKKKREEKKIGGCIRVALVAL